MAHAGSLDEKLPELAGPFEPIGSTDTEQLFCQLLNKCVERNWRSLGEVDFDVMCEWIGELNEIGGMTMCLTDGKDLLVHSDRRGDPLWLGQLAPPYDRIAFGDGLARALDALRRRAHLHARFDLSNTGGGADPRAFHFHRTYPAHRHRVQVGVMAQHRNVDAQLPSGFPERRPHGSLHREGFRRKFAHDDVEGRDDEERDRERDALDRARILEDAAQQGLDDEVTDGGLADPSKPEARERDAELARGEIRVQVVRDVEGGADAGPARHRVELGLSDLDDGELGRDKPRQLPGTRRTTISRRVSVISISSKTPIRPRKPEPLHCGQPRPAKKRTLACSPVKRRPNAPTKSGWSEKKIVTTAAVEYRRAPTCAI